MKFKILLLTVVCIFFGLLITKHNELIKIPKEERQLVQVNEKIKTGKVIMVSDGDSFILDDSTKIRLFGIDAPELLQTCILISETTNKSTNETITKEEQIPCGENSRNKLSEIVGNNEMRCLIKGKDAFGRLVGECSFETYNRKTKRKDKININKEMVLSGNAVAFQQISDKYLEDENKAKAENKGIWSTTFETPSIYRKKNIKN